ncbi:hypothetical protein BE17_08215 [Sorangium cellulosum]|uniref:Secreted protein n=1 Tax=Sorangium cellulosum TaxID=56 RepID=A0A150S0Q9_SORCE|nr:hypothetical protein BE17_08215 [Sorangium cellulosum]
MKSWVFAAFLISGCALVACGDDGNTATGGTTGTTGTTGTGGSGGSGGSGGNGGSGGDGGSGGNGGSSTTSSSSTGTPTCDETTDTCGRDDNTGCYKCAAEGPCKETIDNCVKDRDCFALVRCLDRCTGEEDPAACAEQCRTDNAAVVEAYDAMAQCTICQECAENCAASEEPLCQE